MVLADAEPHEVIHALTVLNVEKGLQQLQLKKILTWPKIKPATH